MGKPSPGQGKVAAKQPDEVEAARKNAPAFPARLRFQSAASCMQRSTHCCTARPT